MQDETSKPLFLLSDHSWDSATTDATTNVRDLINEKLGKQETTMNVDIGSEVVVSGPVPTPETEKRNNMTMRRKVSYVDNHSW